MLRAQTNNSNPVCNNTASIICHHQTCSIESVDRKFHMFLSSAVSRGGGMRQGSEANHSSLSSTEVKKG
jgi:hypothetical protein